MNATLGPIPRAAARAARDAAALAGLNGSLVVVKYGGAAMERAADLDRFAAAVARVASAGAHLIVVHGGGPALTRALAGRGVESRFEGGHRVTSPEAAEIAESVLSGTTNRAVAAALGRAGLAALGLAGGDGALLAVEPYRPNGLDLGRVGQVRAVHASRLLRLVDAGFVPVLSSTVRGDDGRPFNVNADGVAGAVAAACGADVIGFLSDVDAVRDAAGRPVRAITPDDACALIAAGVANGGMRPKLEAAVLAVRAGVPRAVLADGRAPDAWPGALAGRGTSATVIAERVADR